MLNMAHHHVTSNYPFSEWNNASLLGPIDNCPSIELLGDSGEVDTVIIVL